MASATNERFRDTIAHAQWDEAADLLQTLTPEDAAALLRKLSFEQQQPLFRRLPLDTARWTGKAVLQSFEESTSQLERRKPSTTHISFIDPLVINTSELSIQPIRSHSA